MSYIPVACIACKRGKRKVRRIYPHQLTQCDGSSPCDCCLKRNQNCLYQASSDKRRRKYHTDYIHFLESKSDFLKAFISKFVADDPALKVRAHSLLSDLDQRESPSPGENGVEKDQQLEQLLDKALNLSLEEDSQPEENCHSDKHSEHDIYHFLENDEFISHLHECFRENVFNFHYGLYGIVSETKDWHTRFADLGFSEKLMYSAYLALGCIYSQHDLSSAAEEAFISLAENLAMPASNNRMSKYLILGYFLLSCYHTGNANESLAYLYNSMSCSVTQHLGYHISYEENGGGRDRDRDRDLPDAPTNSPLDSAILWSVCLGDRIITSRINVPCCIHYKRIIASLYQPILSPGMAFYQEELIFAYESRLWYITDRFTDQIYSTYTDLGDSHQVHRLLGVGTKALSDLQNSLPVDMMLDLSVDEPHRNLLVFHFDFCICMMTVHKPFINHNRSSKEEILLYCNRAIGILRHINKFYLFKNMPYHMNSSIVGLILAHVAFLTRWRSQRDMTSEEGARRFEIMGESLRFCLGIICELAEQWTGLQRVVEKVHLLMEESGLMFFS